jgi:hypothetical protein
MEKSIQAIRVGRGHKLSTRACPECGTMLDGATGISDSPDDPIIPCEGDLSVCMYCGLALAFTNGGLRACTVAEWNKLSPVMQDAMRAVIEHPIHFQGD